MPQTVCAACVWCFYDLPVFAPGIPVAGEATDDIHYFREVFLVPALLSSTHRALPRPAFIVTGPRITEVSLCWDRSWPYMGCSPHTDRPVIAQPMEGFMAFTAAGARGSRFVPG